MVQVTGMGRKKDMLFTVEVAELAIGGRSWCTAVSYEQVARCGVTITDFENGVIISVRTYEGSQKFTMNVNGLSYNPRYNDRSQNERNP